MTRSADQLLPGAPRQDPESPPDAPPAGRTAIERSPSLLSWDTLSNPQRFEAYNRWSMLAFLPVVPLMGLAVLAGPEPAEPLRALIVLVALTAHCAAAFLAVHWGINYVLGRRALPVGGLRLLAGTTTGLLLAIALVYPGVIGGLGTIEDARQLLYALLLVVMPLMIGLSPYLRALTLTASGAVAGAAITAIVVIGGGAQIAILALMFGVGGAWLLGLSGRASIWTISLVWDLDRRREVDARLAVAEERLRFSRDLHDVFGRTLSTVAIKSELAATLADRGDPRGAQEMMAVRELAQDALREVRGVVQGYRAVDLGTELLGAREILVASGIEVTTSGEHHRLPEPVQQALAWVVREGVTNVVRHSRARACRITVVDQGGGHTLQITNDGVLPAATQGRPLHGSGLAGLTERLNALGGVVQTERTEDRFTLSAWVPDRVNQPPPSPTSPPYPLKEMP